METTGEYAVHLMENLRRVGSTEVRIQTSEYRDKIQDIRPKESDVRIQNSNFSPTPSPAGEGDEV